ncbi:dyslexia-associated protein KIAA0319 homolog isoform X4 [Callithrix jacchus]|uniref:dyslexia-associated protein KIAA0319 homolog isoform X4 n=1 Tax=Callithrix jacchus TaxID=9483 RepID=UPI0023DCF8DA|nr:dyslexia-associated protein KIAA0319 homolog isoform X4 [Callithrix jacchus]
MAAPTGVLSSLLLLLTIAGCACKQCSEGRTYSNAVISPNLEAARIMRVSHTFPVVDCTAACCDLPSCDLAWWLEGRCYLVSCPHKENCEPKKMGLIRSYLTFVLRPVQRPAKLLDYGDMMLNRGSPSGTWGDSPEDIRRDLPFLGKDRGIEEMSEYSADYRELEKDLLQPSGKQEPRAGAEYPDWGLLPGSDGGFNSSAGDSPAAPAEKQQEPQLHHLNESASTHAPKLPERSVLLPLATTPSSGEVLEKEKASQLQGQSSSSSGKEVLMPSHSPPPASLELSPATVEKSPVLTVTAGSTEHSFPTPPTSTALSGSTPSERPISPTTAPRTVKELTVSAGDNLIITFPDNQVELKAFVAPAPPAETTYNYEWSLISHPIDYRGEIKQGRMQTLTLSQLSVGLYVFKVAVSNENAFGEAFVNVTVKPARRVNLPPVAVVSPQMQELTLPLTSALIDGSQSTDDTEIVSYHWEEISGPLIEERTSVDSPVLRLSHLDPGNYSFRLTVTDSDGTTNATTAALIVNSAVDFPPVANAGPNHTITLPQNSITLNGNQSSDDHQIVFYEWSLGPGSEGKHVAMQAIQTPFLHLSAMQEGDYTFRLMVTDSSRQQSTAVVTVIVLPENNRPPVAVAGPDKELIFPVQSATLDGSRSSDDHGIVFYRWEHVRGPSAVEMENTDKAVATVTGLQVGTYHFRLTVKDRQGLSSTSALTVAVKKDPRKSGLVELTLQVGAGQLTEQRKDTLVRQLAVLLNVLDSDIKVQKIRAHSDLSTVIVFYVQSGPPFKVLKAAEVARSLHMRLSKEKADFLLFKVLRIDTAGCLLKCSGHGHCDPLTKRCICSQLWMENLIQRYIRDGESNCEWSIFSVTVLAFTLTVLTGGFAWLCICYCKRQKRTKIRKKTKYTILDNMDEQERMELRPKYGVKHRSTEHNSSLMVSESEFDSDQDTIFSREKMERRNPKASMTGSIRNGASSSSCSKDR